MNSRSRRYVFDVRRKLFKADFTRREAASLPGEHWDLNGRTLRWL
jgi:hypothetical protein